MPDWVVELSAETCEPSPIAWEGWNADIATFCTVFDAIHPKRNQQEWRDHWPDEYGKPLLVPKDGSERSVAEFEVVKAFRACGWDANWQDSFGAASAWMKPWTRAETQVPQALSAVLARVRSASPKAKPWDVLAWRGDEVAFVECKAPKEKFTKAESAFIWAARNAGVSVERFAVVCGEIRYPERN